MPISFREPVPDDAPAWFAFLVREQARTYRGTVPEDFADGQYAYFDTWVPELAESFARPGTSRRLLAEDDGELVGVAAVGDSPQPWEIEAGYVPSPAPRELERLYVAGSHHGTGLAAELFAGVDAGEDMYLWLIDGNERAQRFYRRRGFIDLDEQFTSGEDWGSIGIHRMARR